MNTKLKERRPERADRAGEKSARSAVPVIAEVASESAADISASPRVPSAKWRVVISALILFHLAAVFAAALRIPPTSQLAIWTAWSVHWYTDVVLVNPGYRFFAPDPGPADMMRVVVIPKAGPPREEVYPDLQQEWPRLRYHRHFMLTSRLSGNPGEPMTQALANSYARHIAAREGAREVRVFRVVHGIPTPDQVLAGTSLKEKQLYRTEFSNPAGDWGSIPAGPFDRTKLELRVALDGTASLQGELLGKSVRSEWKWQQGPPNGPPQVGFFAAAKALPDWTADWPEPNNLVLHYPVSGARVGANGETVEHVPMRRGETPPLAVYRGDER